MASLFLGQDEKQAAAAAEGAQDAKSVSAFVKQLGAQPADLIRFFDKKDFYLLHGRDADTVASSYFKSTACLKFFTQGGERHPYLCINKKMAAEVIRVALVEQRRRVEVYVLERSGWLLERKGSPGNLQAFEEECLLGGTRAPTESVIAAVKLGRTAGSKGYSGDARLVGVCFVDCAARSIRVSEFEDDESLSTLESLLCQQGTRECVLAPESSDAERRQMADMLSLCEVASTEAKKGSFKIKDVEQDLRRLLGKKELHGRAFESRQQLSLSACSGLISYLDLMGHAESHAQWKLEWTEPNQFMRLDAGALRALSVEPQPGEADKHASLLGIFAGCKTIAGGRLTRKWLKQPLLSVHDISERLDTVQVLVTCFDLRATLREEVLPTMACDLDRLSRKLYSAKGTLLDVYALYQYVQRLPRLLQVLDGAADSEDVSEEDGALLRSAFIEPLQGAHGNFAQFLKLVEAAVDLEAVSRHEYLLQSHFTPELRELHESREACYDKIEAHYEAMQEKLGLDSGKLKLEQTAQHGYVLRVTRKDEKVLRSVGGIAVLQTKKEGVLFRDSKLTNLGGQYRELTSQYEKEQATLVTKVVDTAATFCVVIEETQQVVARLDVLLNFAQVSVSAPEPYVRPTLLSPEEGRRIELVGCRHPCVERMEGVRYIKNDVALVAGESALQIVTGPNMGGKSTYIRAVGVNMLLAQVGCFVPCDEARISPVDAVLARVGAGDMQSRGVSTFMAEMLETASIIKNATPSSLVIIDELGRGTSTYDGYGLAHAICTHLVGKLHSLCLFATHFHELTALSDEFPSAVNKHVSAHAAEGEFTMLYKVEDGPADQSFGIYVAEASKFPPTVIAAAKRKLAELEEPQTVLAKRPLSEDDRAHGLEEVRSCLRQFSQIPLEEGDAQIHARIIELQEKLRSSANPLVKSICEQAALPPAAI